MRYLSLIFIGTKLLFSSTLIYEIFIFNFYKYKTIVKYKTAFYFLTLPVTLAMYMVSPKVFDYMVNISITGHQCLVVYYYYYGYLLLLYYVKNFTSKIMFCMKLLRINLFQFEL